MTQKLKRPVPKRTIELPVHEVTVRKAARSPVSKYLQKGAYSRLREGRIERIELERQGIDASEVKALASTLGMNLDRLYTIIGVSRATAQRKTRSGGTIDGMPGLALIALNELLELAQDMADDSLSDDIRGFDVGRWLGRWLETPIAALGDKPPTEYLDAPAGASAVKRVLGALRSGAYQ